MPSRLYTLEGQRHNSAKQQDWQRECLHMYFSIIYVDFEHHPVRLSEGSALGRAARETAASPLCPSHALRWEEFPSRKLAQPSKLPQPRSKRAPSRQCAMLEYGTGIMEFIDRMTA